MRALVALQSVRPYGACFNASLTSRQSLATNPSPPALLIRSSMKACSGLSLPLGAFTSTPSNRPSRNCPSTSGQPVKPNRMKRPPTLAAPEFIRSHQLTAGWARKAFKTSHNAAASGLLLVRLVVAMVSPSKSTGRASQTLANLCVDADRKLSHF